MPATTTMKGGGYYDKHSTLQGESIEGLAGWIDEAVATLALPPAPQPIVLLDLGSSEGRNALGLMERVAAGLRRRQSEQPIQTVYSDLPSNNFNQLFANLEDARLRATVRARAVCQRHGGLLLHGAAAVWHGPPGDLLQRRAVAGPPTGADPRLRQLPSPRAAAARAARRAGSGRGLHPAGGTGLDPLPGVPRLRTGARRQTAGRHARRLRRRPRLRRHPRSSQRLPPGPGRRRLPCRANGTKG